MKKFKRMVAVTGKYTDKNGDEKKQYTTIGTLSQKENGELSAKMEAVPVNWDGWVNFYEFDDKKKATDF